MLSLLHQLLSINEQITLNITKQLISNNAMGTLTMLANTYNLSPKERQFIGNIQQILLSQKAPAHAMQVSQEPRSWIRDAISYRNEWCFSPVKLVPSDLKLLCDLALRLKWMEDINSCTDAMYQLYYLVMEDFPAEIVLQKETQIFASLCVVFNGQSSTIASHEYDVVLDCALSCLHKLIDKLQESLNLQCDLNVVSNVTSTSTMTIPNVHSRFDGDNLGYFYPPPQLHCLCSDSITQESPELEALGRKQQAKDAKGVARNRNRNKEEEEEEEEDNGDDSDNDDDNENKIKQKLKKEVSKPCVHANYMHSLTEFVHELLAILSRHWLHANVKRKFQVLKTCQKLVHFHYNLKKKSNEKQMTRCNVQCLVKAMESLQHYFHEISASWPKPNTLEEWFLIEMLRMTLELISFLPEDLVGTFMYTHVYINVCTYNYYVQMYTHAIKQKVDDYVVPSSISSVACQFVTQYMDLSALYLDIKSDCIKLLRLLRPLIFKVLYLVFVCEEGYFVVLHLF
ncbi:hypothetical protein RFI_28351 [Reticulomyxa filosa]|uniref:Uncharacterized protein n=1 Tax=Reticulomyxa filosa TaxID=46433 RepID=X6M556_RETFI|nr:hypothetical protein RFI_28351 [Reticulomyxa filosa]|eukprot:ETO09039.1 hypothetical protein RFI_28351 [Reticulomyxa filosa]